MERGKFSVIDQEDSLAPFFGKPWVKALYIYAAEEKKRNEPHPHDAFFLRNVNFPELPGWLNNNEDVEDWIAKVTLAIYDGFEPELICRFDVAKL